MTRVRANVHLSHAVTRFSLDPLLPVHFCVSPVTQILQMPNNTYDLQGPSNLAGRRVNKEDAVSVVRGKLVPLEQDPC